MNAPLRVAVTPGPFTPGVSASWRSMTLADPTADGVVLGEVTPVADADVALFPYLWYWQVWGGGPDYPWWGREYDCALEPWTSRPDGGLLEAIANGTAHTIEGGETRTSRIHAVMWSGRDGIAGIDADGTVR